jgi:hypothetical protein
MASEAVVRVHESFAVMVADTLEDVAVQIDAIVDGMWKEGWNSADGDVNLFATDLGSILSIALRNEFSGRLLFRSRTDLSHVSIWWEDLAIETFPFHKVFKRLVNVDGESVSFYIAGLKYILRH